MEEAGQGTGPRVWAWRCYSQCQLEVECGKPGFRGCQSLTLSSQGGRGDPGYGWWQEQRGKWENVFITFLIAMTKYLTSNSRGRKTIWFTMEVHTVYDDGEGLVAEWLPVVAVKTCSHLGISASRERWTLTFIWFSVPPPFYSVWTQNLWGASATLGWLFPPQLILFGNTPALPRCRSPRWFQI